MRELLRGLKLVVQRFPTRERGLAGGIVVETLRGLVGSTAFTMPSAGSPVTQYR